MAKTKSKTTFTPIEDRVMVRATEEDSVSRGGIVLPDAAKEKPQRGKVLAAGPGRLDKKGKRLPMPVSAGDMVIFGKYAGNDIEIGGEEFKILRADEILAKLTH